MIRIDDYQYIEKDCLGLGHFGSTYCGQHFKTREKVAIKVIKNGKPSKGQFKQIENIRNIESANVVQILSHKVTPKNIYLIMELCDSDFNRYVLNKGKRFKTKEIFYFLQQSVTGLNSIHQSNIVHGNIKPENILVTRKNYQVVYKISDFLISKIIKETERKKNIPSPMFSAPEVLQGRPVSHKSDIYSLGKLVCFMWTRNINNLRYDGNFQNLNQLIADMLEDDWKKRANLDFIEKNILISVEAMKEDSFENIMPEKESIDFLGETYNISIRPYIDVIDNLRRFGIQQDIGLPNVVVVGDQSSGKSSIIEAISGVQLPRGKGIVTRCPLELQLKRMFDKPWKATLTYKTLSGSNEKIEITDPNAVEKEVREAQEKMCETNKGVSKELITLRIESPAKTAPDLTLIDLPGIARIAVDGQPADICHQIKRIILNHVENENTVILCVVSANLDAAVNESINIAKRVDPVGIRTLGVITKPDLVDESNKEDVLCLLNNEKITLEKGFHMVKCRSQKELEDGLSLEQSIENEKLFFEDEKYYRNANKSQLGTYNLANKITEELVEVIQNTLPGLRDQINNALQESSDKIQSLPQGVPESKNEKLTYLIQVISEMNNEIKENLYKGKTRSSEDNLFYQWRQSFEKMKTALNILKSDAMKKRFTLVKLKEEMLKKRGNEINGFLNFDLFETLINKHIEQYKEVAKRLLKEIKDNTENILTDIVHENFKHLPALEADLKHISVRELQKAFEKSTECVDTIFEEEKLVFTLDEEFERQMNKLKEEEIKLLQSSGRKKEKVEDCLLKNTKRLIEIIDCYLMIVHRRLFDGIPMAARQCLHIELCQNLKECILKYVTSPGVEEKVTENKKMNEDRRKLQDKIERLQNARYELLKI